MIPYLTFSIFHALDYVRTNIIPTVFPSSATTDTNVVSWQVNTQTKIKSLYDKYYGPAMRFVAQAEVTVIVLRLFLDVLR